MRAPRLLALLGCALNACAPGEIANPDELNPDAQSPPPQGSMDATAPPTQPPAPPPPPPPPPTSGFDVPMVSLDGCSVAAGVNPTLLPPCCDLGSARCVPSSFVPPALAAQFDTCMGGRCVPDSIVRAGASFRPARCASLGGVDGRCLSLCIPMVATNRALLPRATCAEDERCAPCVNPLTGLSSGACDEVNPCGPDGGAPSDGSPRSPDGNSSPSDVPVVCPHVGPPVLNPATFPECCTVGGARCVPSALVSPDQASQLVRCPGGYCAPEEFIASAGRFIPPTCASVGGAEGRCLSVCLGPVAAQMSLLPVASCRPNQRCVPCYDPFTSASTAACTQSCDPGPTRPPVVFARCCSNRGRCIPVSAVPLANRMSVVQRDCTMDSLCVPEENLDRNFHGPRCSGVLRFLNQAYTGVCVSTCSRLGVLGFLTLEQGSCSRDHVCAPCTDPLSMRPTGAPGC